MKKPIDTILFDLDGTLLDSNEIIIRSYKHAYRKHLSNLEFTREQIIKDIGPPLEAIFKKYTNDSETINALYKSYLDYYAAHEKEYLFAYDGVMEVLEYLKKKGYNLAIVTSKFYYSAEPSIKMFNLDKYFDVITTLDDVENPKPAKDACVHALNQFKDWNQALMIGDNDSDILSGKNANILTAGVIWSIKGKETLEEAKPDYMLESMYSLLDILKEDGGK